MNPGSGPFWRLKIPRPPVVFLLWSLASDFPCRLRSIGCGSKLGTPNLTLAWKQGLTTFGPIPLIWTHTHFSLVSCDHFGPNPHVRQVFDDGTPFGMFVVFLQVFYNGTPFGMFVVFCKSFMTVPLLECFLLGGGKHMATRPIWGSPDLPSVRQKSLELPGASPWRARPSAVPRCQRRPPGARYWTSPRPRT